MLESPSYIYASPPDEGGTLTISWEKVDTAEGYVLERRFNEDFTMPAVGLTWENIHESDNTWLEHKSHEKTWAQFELEPTVLIIARFSKSDFEEQDGRIIFSDWMRYLQYGLEKVAYRVRAYKDDSESEPQESELQFIAPACLHVPTLYEGESAAISWRQITGANQYTLERRWNENFGIPSIGPTWENIESKDRTWGQHESANSNWADYQNTPSGFVVYAGPGSPSPAPAMGLDWRDIGSSGLSWDGFGGKELSWAQCLPFFSKGLSWSDQRATYSTWMELGTRDLRWDAMEALADKSPHASYTDSIAISMKKAVYRLKARNELGKTTYITAAPVKIIPIFERDDEVIWRAYQGERYRFKLDCTQVRTFRRPDGLPVIMKIKYDKSLLRLVNFIMPTPAKTRGSEYAPGAFIVVRSHIGGELDFTFNRPIAGADEWSGLITHLQFEALRSGNAMLRLS